MNRAARLLLDNLRAAGFHLRLDDADRVLVSPAPKLTPQLRQEIAAHRDALAALLREGQDGRGRPPPAEHRGWVKLNGGPWQIACRQPSYDQCWETLLAMPFEGPRVDRLVLPMEQTP